MTEFEGKLPQQFRQHQLQRHICADFVTEMKDATATEICESVDCRRVRLP